MEATEKDRADSIQDHWVNCRCCLRILNTSRGPAQNKLGLCGFSRSNDIERLEVHSNVTLRFHLYRQCGSTARDGKQPSRRSPITTFARGASQVASIQGFGGLENGRRAEKGCLHTRTWDIAVACTCLWSTAVLRAGEFGTAQSSLRGIKWKGISPALGDVHTDLPRHDRTRMK